MCDEITNLFRNLNNCINEVWEWINDFIVHFTGYVIFFLCQIKKLNHISKGAWLCILNIQAG